MKDLKKDLNKKEQLDEKTMDQVTGGHYSPSHNEIEFNQGNTNEANCINPKQKIIKF